MAKAIHNSTSVSGAPSQTLSLSTVMVQRLALGYVALLGAAIFLVGVSWDIQWHIFVGRDRTLVPPHQMMLGGIAVGGIAALISVVLETVWSGRNTSTSGISTSFAGMFNSSLGAYIAGFAALDAAIAFPLDSYWHALYGIDVAIWAPFHVMIIASAGLIPLGSAYMLISAAHLASAMQNRKVVRAGYIGAIISLGAVLGIFTLLLDDAISRGNTLFFGSTGISLFPIFSCLIVAAVLVMALYAIPWRFAATQVIVVYILFAGIDQLFVSPSTSALVISEHLTYRRELGQFAQLSIVATYFWFLAPVIVAIVFDLLFMMAKRKNWSARTIFTAFALVTLIAGFPISVLVPTRFLSVVNNTGLVGFVLSLVIGLGGAAIGIWAGQRLGTSMQQVERVEQ